LKYLCIFIEKLVDTDDIKLDTEEHSHHLNNNELCIDQRYNVNYIF